MFGLVVACHVHDENIRCATAFHTSKKHHQAPKACGSRRAAQDALDLADLLQLFPQGTHIVALPGAVGQLSSWF